MQSFGSVADDDGLAAGRHDFLPTRSVVWGEGSAGRIGEELDRLDCGSAVLITTRSLTGGPSLARLRERLGSRLLSVLDNFPAHVPAQALEQAQFAIEAHSPDAFVAFGGGSVIDATKALAARIGRAEGKVPPILALPTTLSGAEFAHVYGVLEDGPQGSYKHSYFDAAVTPAVVLLDPHLTLETPRQLWLSSGIKAIDHAVEGFLGPGRRLINDPIALSGLRRMAEALVRDDWETPKARLAAQIAAWLCYFSPASARTGLSHRIGYVLGGYFQLPHSITSCITLAPVMRRFAALEHSKTEELAKALLPAGSVAPNVATFIADLVVGLELPHRLRETGLGQNAVPRIGELVRRHFPEDSARIDGLGPDAFDVLIEELW